MIARKREFTLFLLFTSVLIPAGVITAQETEHFTFTSNTGNNMTVLVKSSINPTIDGEALGNGDEIGVYNDDGLCVGATIWSGQNCPITVWGDNDQTDENDGMASGDTLRFRLWDKSASDEFEAEITFEDEDDLTYGVDAIAILSSLEATTTGVSAAGCADKLFRNAEGSFRVYDIKGRLVQRLRTQPFSGINPGKKMMLPAGAFLIKRSDEEGTSIRKCTLIR